MITGTLLCSMGILKTDLHSIEFEINQWNIIKKVYKIIFPSNTQYNIEDYTPTQYLFNISRDKYFSKEDLSFILNGAKWIQEDKINVDSSMDELLETSWGENWLSYLLNYALEGLYSDPIYGGNIEQIGWDMIGHTQGTPQPTKRYGK